MVLERRVDDPFDRHFRPGEALEWLRSHGIDAQLPDEQALSVMPDFGLGGYRLIVPREEFFSAQAQLRAPTFERRERHIAQVICVADVAASMNERHTVLAR